MKDIAEGWEVNIKVCHFAWPGAGEKKAARRCWGRGTTPLFFLNTLVLLGSSYTAECSEKKDCIDSTDLFLFLPTGIKS